MGGLKLIKDEINNNNWFSTRDIVAHEYEKGGASLVISFRYGSYNTYIVTTLTRNLDIVSFTMQHYHVSNYFSNTQSNIAREEIIQNISLEWLKGCILYSREQNNRT